MARKVNGPKAGERTKFIPESYGNKNDSDPVTIWFKNPTLRERRELFSGAFAGLAPGESVESLEVDLKSSFLIYEDAIKRFVVSVENYSYASGEITSGELLVEHGELDIILEVANQILGEGDEKKSEELLGSTPQKTQPLSGTAESALPRASTGPETVATPTTLSSSM